MPIKDLVERYRFGDGLPRFAIIRKGAPKTSETRPGADLDGYFRVVMQPGFERFTSTVETLFGNKPEMFTPVRFLGATMDDVFDFWMEEHRSSKMLHRCDGETQTQWLDESTGELCRGAKACDRKSATPCACKPSAQLKFSLPELNREIGLPGYVVLLTTSWEDVRNLMSCFKDIERMGFTDLRRVEFTIGRAPKAINAPVQQPKNDGERKKFREDHKGRDWMPGEKAKRKKSLIYFRVTERFSREFMLPLPLSAPMLGDGVTTPVIPPSVTGNKILTEASEHPSRRIGAPEPEPPPILEGDYEEDEDEEGELIPEFALPNWEMSASKNQDMWDKFLKTALEKFNMPETKVIELLNAFEGMGLGNWRVKRNLASAVLIADFELYDCKAIETYTSKMLKITPDSAFEIYTAACQVAEWMKAKLGELA